MQGWCVLLPSVSGEGGLMANRGMFGYEGEGFMRRGFRRGYPDVDSGRGSNFRLNDYSEFNRGDYNRPGGYGRESAGDYGTPRRSFRGRGPKNYQRSDERIR